MEQSITEADKQYMRRAIALAKQGEGFVHPNPLVGAVIVKEGRIIGEGYHHQFGGLHAEREAIASLQENPEGSTIYVTLEPCCHYGKTPPCTEAIIQQGIRRVVIGSKDPNPLVAGKGVQQLRAKGIVVEEQVLKEECDALNAIFFHYITTQTPYVISKYAMTLDGKIATKTGDAKWISGEESRREVHVLRHRCMAILVGIQTVLADDPMLNVRLDSPVRNPLRIVLDSHLRIPMESKMITTAKEIPTLVVTRVPKPAEEDQHKMRRAALEQKGVQILEMHPLPNGKLPLRGLMQELGKRQVDSVLIEGGATVHAAAIEEDILQELQVYIGPKIFGGDAPSAVGGEGISLVADAKSFQLMDLQKVGTDVKLCYRRAR